MAMGNVGALGGAGVSPVGESSATKGDFARLLEGMKGPAKPPGVPVAGEAGRHHLVPAERTEAVRGPCEARGGDAAVGGVSSVSAAAPSRAVRVLDQVGEAQRRLDHVLALAESGRSFSPAELLAFQAHVYRASQELDLAGKVVEKAVGGVKQILQTQV
ncbi:ATP-dependent helicase HrpB [Archangium primigenium]|uniref:ATP-dependent helicase HrpB n=1 Tax=[Archangium] primigenium TaxID=2792470 RepID=UPI00195C09E5|nr:ATP-dependent helicase HrpB [Archangium primigenium]MBM7114258.1 ATP-dependent helicase HrpB [Archangium primigenium]